MSLSCKSPNIFCIVSFLLIFIVPNVFSNVNIFGNKTYAKKEEEIPVEKTYKGIVLQAIANHSASIIFIHGFTPTESEESKNWSTIFKNIRKPYMKVVCPHPYFIQNEIGKKGLSWYYTSAYILGMEGFKGALNYTQSLIQKEIDSGIRPENIIVGGSAQGAILALSSVIKFPQKLGGLIIVNLHLPHKLREDMVESYVPANRDIDVLHCEQHPILAENALRWSSSVVRNLTENIEFRLYDESPNLMPPEGIEDFKTFINTHIAKT